MNTAWSIYSGVQLKDQIVENASFRIITDGALDSILLRSESLKQSFRNKLREQLSGLAMPNATPRTLTIACQSAVVLDESFRREVELSVVVMDEESDSMLWYFMLRSPERNISPHNLDEIVSLIVNRLCAVKTNGTHKDCP
jgi:hypothetical protein